MTETGASERWIFRPRPVTAPKLRLFCVPFAGGGASLYRDWPYLVNSRVEVCSLQMPGRESRFREPPFTRVSDAVQAAADALQPYLDVPFAFFGHSMGAVISFELARHLRIQNNITPVHLFVSARRAPQFPDPRPLLSSLQNDRFVAEIRRRYNGIPGEVLSDPELMELLLPVLRADVEMLETYAYQPGLPLECPVTAFGGGEDTEACFETLEGWREHTKARFQTRMFAGNHFFLKSSQKQLLDAISQELNAGID